MNKLRKYPTYRNALHTQSILTITSNVVYGKATGNTPDGRRQGEPFAPGANPMHGTRQPWNSCLGCVGRQDSIPRCCGRHFSYGYAGAARSGPCRRGSNHESHRHARRVLRATGYHMNINVLNREMLLDAMDHPEKYPHLTIRVSGYAVNFVRLTREQQMDVINRTFHGQRNHA